MNFTEASLFWGFLLVYGVVVMTSSGSTLDSAFSALAKSLAVGTVGCLEA